MPQEDRLARDTLFVMATRAEYLDALRARIDPFVCGVGPVEAAVAVTRHLAQRERLPDLVVSLGSAGSATLEQAGVYQASSVSWRDMDASPIGFARGETPFADLPIALPLETPLEVPAARLSTGANIVSGEAYGAIDADMVDMETFAVKRACMAFDVPVMSLRGISDGAEPVRRYADWSQALPEIDRRLAEAIEPLL